MIHTYLACFDISNDYSRRRVALLLEEHGLRVQRSVFEISVHSDEQLRSLRKSLNYWLDSDDDLRFYHLCAACRKQSSDSQGNDIATFPLTVLL